MGDPKGGSKKRSSGKQVKSKPLKNFTLYLDESFDCEEVKALLSKNNIKFRVYTEDFKGGAEDPNILPKVGKRGLARVYQKMRKFAREHSRPFVAVITKAGDIYLRMDHRGNISGPGKGSKLV